MYVVFIRYNFDYESQSGDEGDYKTKTKNQRPKIQDPKSTICGLTFAE